MSLLTVTLVILVTSLVVLLGVGQLIQRGNRRLDRIRMLYQLDEAAARVQLPQAGRLELVAAHVCSICGTSWDTPDGLCRCARSFAGAQDPAYRLFPDTGPLLIWSEGEAAKVELGQWTQRRISETDWLIEAGEREIGPVQ